MNYSFFKFLTLLFTLSCSCYINHNKSKETSNASLTGIYFDQILPTDNPEVFAKDLVKNCPTFSKDLLDLYFRGYDSNGILYMSNKKGIWSKPTPLLEESKEYSDYNPSLSPDCLTLIFASNRPISNTPVEQIRQNP